MNSLYRQIVLTVAGNRLMEKLALKYGFQLGASRFVAGLTAEDAILEMNRLRSEGILSTVDHLGEAVRSFSEAIEFESEYLKLVDELREARPDAYISLKPTQFGLKIHKENSYRLIREIVKKADGHGLFVRLDMEDSPFTEDTIRIATRLREEGYEQVGTVIQAYLYRSEEDVRRLTEAGMNLRLVKGAYKEPASIAWTSMEKIRENFRHLIALRLDSGVYTAVATHDDEIIEWTKEYARQKGISPDKYEFQFLYGMRTELQRQLAQEGYTVRSYVPYGQMWYPYFLRRLAERPENLWFVLKNWTRR